MSAAPQRPPRPDEEGELARFHNGDTLDNIPVIRVPAPPEPRRVTPTRWIAVAACVGILGGVAGAIIARSAGNNDPAAAPSPAVTTSAAAESPAESDPQAVEDTPPSPPSPSAPPQARTEGQVVEQVRIIQTPPTGGDPSSTYCLVYTGSESGPEREAILLQNAPGYQCGDLLPYDPTGQQPALSVEAPICEAPSRTAVLNFAEVGGWDGELLYTCLTEHNGA